MTQQAVPDSVEYCLARAEESERMAAEAVDEKNKAIYRDLASRWRQLATEGETDALKPVGQRRRPS
jgi:hypothetical protein